MEDAEISRIINELGEDHESYFNAVAPPIIQTSNFVFKTVDDLRHAFSREEDVFLYSRGNNPTLHILQQKLAALDGAEAALVLNSGASAIFCSVVPFVKAGDHIVSVHHPYTWAKKLFEEILPRFGVTTSYIPGTDIQQWEQALQPNTRLLYLESPNSWTYELQDLEAVSALAKKHGLLTVVDNSYCTPLYQQPHAYGIDISLQSATKYIGGHSDVVAGVITGSKKLLSTIFNVEYMTAGNGATPFHAWLLLRGLRTLPVRLAHIAQSTQLMVEWLLQQPWCEALLFPFHPSFPQYELAKRQMRNAAGLLTFSLNATREEIEAFCNALQHFRMAVSWGGHESLIIPRCAGLAPEAFDGSAYHRQLRLYIGLESVDLLKADLQQAAQRAGL